MKKNILVVFPSGEFCRNCADYLSSSGDHVDCATSAAEAQNLLEQKKYDVLVTEIILEYEDAGLVLIHHAHKLFKNMQIIIFSDADFVTDGTITGVTNPDFREWIPAGIVLVKRPNFIQLGISIHLFPDAQRKRK